MIKTSNPKKKRSKKGERQEEVAILSVPVEPQTKKAGEKAHKIETGEVR